MIPEPCFPEILSHFNFAGEYTGIVPHRFGHIHDTYFVDYRGINGRGSRYVIQRINHFVFKQPEMVMDNILAITTHLRRKLTGLGKDPGRGTLSLIPTRDGQTFYRAADGQYWRAYVFIENAQTYMVPENLQHVYHAARAYGDFQQLLSDFPIDQLHCTIPDFHHTSKRFNTFMEVVEQDPVERASKVRAEIDFLLQRRSGTSVLVGLIEEGKLPLRVTHNDTKFNNVMIDDNSGEAICVIDLDTVMPGSALYDFGDAIRSIANTAGEDEPDLSKVHFSMQVFNKYTEGYLDSTRGLLTRTEIDNLAFSAWLMTLECGMRFLSDYLSGDVYFRIDHADHNLDRCRTQFKLVQEIESGFDTMQRIVLDCLETDRNESRVQLQGRNLDRLEN